MQFVCHEVIELLYLGEGCLEFCANAARENKLSLIVDLCINGSEDRMGNLTYME